MLCFVFAALIVALDQFFKHWIMQTLEIGGVWTNEAGEELIPGVLGLTRWENDGAMLNILSGQQWILAGIAFAAAIVLVMILLRYNEGFWGTLGLAAVLGGTVGNLVDRIFNEGKVVDMFRTLFIEFPIFNIADIFITLGFITFLIHFIALSFGAKSSEGNIREYAENDYPEERTEQEYDEFPNIDAIVSAQAEQDAADTYMPSNVIPMNTAYTGYEQDSLYTSQTQHVPDSVQPMSGDYEPISEATADTSFSLDELAAELEDYNVDDLLREYGYGDDDTL